jgi:protein-disulfide isomerase
VDQVLKAYPNEVKFVYKEFPLTSIHQNALNAAKAAVAAQKQGKFWEMHDKLFANQRTLSPDNLKQYAKEIELDEAKFEKDMTSPEVQEQLDADMKLAQEADVRGTPTLFLNGKRVMNRSFEGLKQMIDEALKQKG